ncbi:hypothetical protein ACLOJK_021083 [Asimina triloba]
MTRQTPWIQPTRSSSFLQPFACERAFRTAIQEGVAEQNYQVPFSYLPLHRSSHKQREGSKFLQLPYLMAVAPQESKPPASKSKGAKGTHYLAKCVLRGSVVLQAVCGHIRSPSSNDIVFGKETSIELAVIGDDGIVQSVCEQPVFGTIKDLSILRWNEKFHAPLPQTQGKDLLVVLSDSGKVSFLAFCAEMHRFFPVTHVQLSEPGNSRNQLGRILAVGYDGCFIAVSAYEDHFALLSLSKSAGSSIVDKKIFYPANDGDTNSRFYQKVSGTIWSMCFISKDDTQLCVDGYNPVLAMILHRRGGSSSLNELLLLECIIRNHTIRVISEYYEPGHLALSIVEVPHLSGYAFMFRVGDILLMDLRDPRKPSCVYKASCSLLGVIEERNSAEDSCRGIDMDDEGMFNVAASALLELSDFGPDLTQGDDPMNIDSEGGKMSNLVCSWSWEPGNSTSSKLIFGLDTGDLYMIDISWDQDGVRVNLSDCLYRGLPCKALLWVKGGFIAALMEMGDGLVLKLESGRLIYSSSIQNIAPILDAAVVDYHNEKEDQMFACCGMGPEGSLRIIRSGISVEKLLSTPPTYQGITGTWTVRMRHSDSYHSFLVLAFVEETRVLSVGLNFSDVTEAVGFQPDACTLACGLVADGLLVQIHRNAVQLCLPTHSAHPAGIPLSTPIITSWSPNNVTISLGAVGKNEIVVATANPCFLYILGLRSSSAFQHEVYEIQCMRLQYEVSCISIPQEAVWSELLKLATSLADDSHQAVLLNEVKAGKIFVVGTHKPSVEVLSFLPETGFKVLAVGPISLTNTSGTAISGCVPQDVRLVLVDRFYILSGLRNGMLLRFEWPVISSASQLDLSTQHLFTDSCLSKMDSSLSSSAASFAFRSHFSANVVEMADSLSPVLLQLIAIRRIGITPVFLVPLHDSLDADVIALSDRPWLLQTARHSLAYTSISFQPATQATPVCAADCPKGILFVAENSLHLVEMVHSKRLNVQKFYLGNTPRKVLYHNESRTLLVMRTEFNGDSTSSDICRIDPLSGSVFHMHKFPVGEIAKCMQLMKVANEQVLVVGTSQSAGRAIMPCGEAESTKGHLFVFILEPVQNSDSSSLIFGPRPSSSQATSPFCEVAGSGTEQLSGSSLCSSPDDNSCDGVKLEETEMWQLREVHCSQLPGIVLSICPYLSRYFLVAAGNVLYVYGFHGENPHRLRRFTSSRTRFAITCLTTLLTRIVVGDCRDGVLFYSYQEDIRKLEQLCCDPVQRLVADCALMDLDTAVVSDRKGNVSILTWKNHSEDNASPECNLTISCSYYIGEIAMSIQKCKKTHAEAVEGSFSYRLPADDVLKNCDSETVLDSVHNSVVACTLLGSVIIFIPITREEHEVLEAVQAKLAVHPLTAPILGNDHNEFRGRESPRLPSSDFKAGVPKILDGDMLAQFLELTSIQQEAVLAGGSTSAGTSSSKRRPPPSVPTDQVVRLLERIHYALN